MGRTAILRWSNSQHFLSHTAAIVLEDYTTSSIKQKQHLYHNSSDSRRFHLKISKRKNGLEFRLLFVAIVCIFAISSAYGVDISQASCKGSWEESVPGEGKVQSDVIRSGEIILGTCTENDNDDTPSPYGYRKKSYQCKEVFFL